MCVSSLVSKIKQMEITFLGLVLTIFFQKHGFVVNAAEVQNESMVSLPGDKNDLIDSSILPDIASLCPYNRFCQSTPTKAIPNAASESCCEKCSCKIDCFEIGNCCPDMPLAGMFKPKYPCVKLSSLTQEITGKKVYNDNQLWYHVITDCSDIQKDVQHPRCRTPTQIQDLAPVSDPESGRVYKNSHCAECNDVKTFTIWNLRVDCLDIYSMSFQTFREREEYIFQNCSLLPQPAGQNAGEMSRCYPDSDIIGVCNFTRQWNHYEKEIENYCLMPTLDQNTIFTEIMRFGKRRYMNVYCYLCNQAHDMSKVDDCLKHRSMDEKFNDVILFSSLIDTPSSYSPVKKAKCKSMEIFDPFKSICRTLTCPGGSVPFYGSCKDLSSQSIGYTVKLFFEITSTSEKTILVNKALLSILEKRVIRQMGSGCGICKSNLRQKNASQLVFSAEVYSAENCSTITLKNGLQQIAAKKRFNAKFRNQGSINSINIELAFDNYDDAKIIQGTNHKLCAERPILLDSSILRHCALIHITEDEALTLGLLNTSGLSKTAFDIDTDVQPVCVDTYFQALEAATSGVPSNNRYSHCKGRFSVMVLVTFFSMYMVFVW